MAQWQSSVSQRLESNTFSELVQRRGEGSSQGEEKQYLSVIPFTLAEDVAMGTPSRGDGALDLTVSGSWFRKADLFPVIFK